MKVKIKKTNEGEYHVFVNQVVVLAIQDDMPSLKQSPNKSMYLWVKVGKTYYKHKIRWFICLKDLKTWIRLSIRQLGLADFLATNNLDSYQNNQYVKTVKIIKQEVLQ